MCSSLAADIDVRVFQQWEQRHLCERISPLMRFLASTAGVEW